MNKRISVVLALVGIAFYFAGTGWASVPAPPVNQNLGQPDTAFTGVTEADCRVCHPGDGVDVADLHHNKYGQPASGSVTLPGTYGTPDGIYVCLSCHESTGTPTNDPDVSGTVSFNIVRDCTVCHSSSPHHTTSEATSGQCTFCHGSFVSDQGNGLTPAYDPSLVTPWPSQGDRGTPATKGTPNGEGSCDFCHNEGTDSLTGLVVLNNHDLHHNTGLPSLGCNMCHLAGAPNDTESRTDQMRRCESCHGYDTLHNIQADSPNSGNIGTLVVGGEDAGWGHVGRDAGPTESDCWGCHGFQLASAPMSGPIIPTLYSANRSVMGAGTDTTIRLAGAGFTNTAHGKEYECVVSLEAADGTTVTLTPDRISERAINVTIPAAVKPGNYRIQAVKDQFTSNATSITVVPSRVNIRRVRGTARGTVVIDGSGFGGYMEGSGLAVKAEQKYRRRIRTEEARVISWSDKRILASFRQPPKEVTVMSLFGASSAPVKPVR